MKLHDQQVLHDPAKGLYGDCFSAVLASLLHLDTHTIPNFAQLSANDPSEFWESVQAYCRVHHQCVLMEVNRNALFARYGDDDQPLFHIISGISPRITGGKHAVLGRDGLIFHDPHPSRLGLAGTPDQWTYYCLVKV